MLSGSALVVQTSATNTTPLILTGVLIPGDSRLHQADLEMQRREVIGELALIFAGQQVKLAVAAGVSEQRSVREQFSEHVGERGAVVFADAVPGFKGGPG